MGYHPDLPPALDLRVPRAQPDPAQCVDAAVLILTSLAGGDKHRRALIADIAEFAGARLPPGTVAAALRRLGELGLVTPPHTDQSTGRRASPSTSGRASQSTGERVHRLTPAGSAALRRYLQQARAVIDTGLARTAMPTPRAA
jgi:DNA-binding PadR family transcriptional regulator